MLNIIRIFIRIPIHIKSVQSLFIFILLGLNLSYTQQASFEIVDIQLKGSMWNDSMKKSHILFQDGGYSFSVPKGRLWLFGDTFLGDKDAQGKLNFIGGKSCTIALQSDELIIPPKLEYRQDNAGIGETPFTFLENESFDTNRIWPLAGIYLHGKYYIYYNLIELTNGEFGFREAGSGLAYSDFALGKYHRILMNQNFRFPIAPSEIIQMGEWLYFYEVGKIGKKNGIILARCLATEIKNPNAYQFWVGTTLFLPRFSKIRSSARLFISDVYGQVSICFNPYLGKYLMACSSDFFSPRTIFIRESENPIQGWSKPVTRIQIPNSQQGEIKLIYCTFFHPALFRNNGKNIVLSYCVMLKKGFSNPEIIECTLQKR